MVRRLRAEVARYEGAVAVGDFAARRAGERDPVSLDEIVRSTGLSKRQISADLGAMSKASRRLFGSVRWPFRALDSAIGMTYLMPAEIASWWLDEVDFWTDPTIDELVRSRSVEPIADPHGLRLDVWDSDEDRQEFVSDVYGSRAAG